MARSSSYTSARRRSCASGAPSRAAAIDAQARALELQVQLQESRLDKQAVDAQLALLQAQIEPHFLFNTLANLRVLIALDRQEKGKGELSAIQEVERDYGAHIIAIIQMSDLIQYLEEKQAEQPELAAQLAAMKAYRAQYGI